MSRALRINASLVFLYMKSTAKYRPASDCPKAMYTAFALFNKAKLGCVSKHLFHLVRLNAMFDGKLVDDVS
jgi:hypothetical protein